MQALEVADSLADASAEKAEQAARDDYSASDRGPVVSAAVRPDGRPDTEADCRSDQNRFGVSMIHPRPCVAFPGIPACRNCHPTSELRKLRQRLPMVRIQPNPGGLRILTGRRDLAASRSAACRVIVSGLCKCSRRQQKRHQQEVNVFCMCHGSMLMTMLMLRLRVCDTFQSVTALREACSQTRRSGAVRQSTTRPAVRRELRGIRQAVLSQ